MMRMSMSAAVFFLAMPVGATSFAPEDVCELDRMQKMSAKDVVFPNVAVNLEVRSSTILVSDCCTNYRLTGTREGIYTYDSSESHTNVTLADSESMDWVVMMIDQLESAGQ